MNSTTPDYCVNSHKLNDRELILAVVPFNSYHESLQTWKKRFAKTFNTTPSKAHEIYYGRAQFTPIERTLLRRIANQKARAQQELNQLEMELGVRG